MYALDRMISTVPFAPNSGIPRSSARPNRDVQEEQLPSSSLPTAVIAKFCVPLNSTIPMRRVEKSLLLEKLQLCSACRSACSSHVLTYANPHVKRLCRLLDFILSFGLRRLSSSYWPLAKEFSCKGQVDLILQLWKPKSNRSRALSWLYQCLNDGVLEFQMQNFSRNISSVRKFYTNSAYVWEVETLETVAIFLRGLENVTFRLFSIEQANTVDFPDSGVSTIISECCAEHERVLTSASKSSIPSTSSLNTNTTSVVKVSPSRKIIRQRGFSSSSSCDVTNNIPQFEMPVADFSECPHVLGLTAPLQDLMLEDTDLCDDAMDFKYPPLHLGGIRASNVLIRNVRKNQTRLSPQPSLITPNPAVVRTIVDYKQQNVDIEQSSSLGSSFDASGIHQPRKANRQEGKYPEFLTDPDTMLSEILARQRIIRAESALTPPMSSTPITSNAQLMNHSPTPARLFRDGDDGLRDYVRSEPDGSDVARGGSTATLVQNDTIYSDDTVRTDAREESEDGQPVNILHHVGGLNGDGAHVPVTSDFEKKIWRRLQTVSNSAAGNWDSLSGVSGDSAEKGQPFRFGAGDNSTGLDAAVPASNDDNGEPVAGEVLLGGREMVDLSMHTFRNDGEQFLKMYRVYINHHYGNASTRYLMLTSYAVYILNSSLLHDDKNDSTTEPPTGLSKFGTDVVVPYSVIDFISVGACSQLFYIFTLQKKQPAAVVCTCNETLTDAILSKLEFTLHRLSSGWSEDKSSNSLHSNDRIPSAVVTGATPQNVALKKWLRGELGKEDIEIARYNLVYWNPNATKMDQQRDISSNEETASGPGRSGYLYVRECLPTAWIWKTSEWKQSFFMLKGKKLYQFEDSTCKVGQRVYDLKDEVSGCRQTQTKEYMYCMEMLFTNDDNVKIHLACQTKHELQQWLYAFVASFSQADSDDVTCECVSCCAVIAGQYLILGQESSNLGFIRTLAAVRLVDVVSSRWCRTHFSLMLEFSSKTEYAHQQWLLSFSCEAEMMRFLKAAIDQESELATSELPSPCDTDTPICAESSRHWSGSTGSE